MAGKYLESVARMAKDAQAPQKAPNRAGVLRWHEREGSSSSQPRFRNIVASEPVTDLACGTDPASKEPPHLDPPHRQDTIVLTSRRRWCASKECWREKNWGPTSLPYI